MNMKKRVTLLIALVSVFCICFSLSACNSNKEKNKQVKLIGFNEVEKEYLEALANLNWPDGYVLPKKLTGETAEQFQAGYGETRASMLWECAWEKEWLEYYRTDATRADKAIKELEKAPDMLYMSPQKCDDATRRYFKDNLDKAKLGDPSGFEENIRLNCPE